MKRKLWDGELGNDGFVVRNEGDKVTTEVIRLDFTHQRDPIKPELDF